MAAEVIVDPEEEEEVFVTPTRRASAIEDLPVDSLTRNLLTICNDIVYYITAILAPKDLQSFSCPLFS